MSKPFQTYETEYPWLVYTYPRSDWLAMILGGLIRGQCAICGDRESMWLGWRGIWFPPKVSMNHWKRDRFIRRHRHDFVAWGHPEWWSMPLLNPEAAKVARQKAEAVLNPERAEA